MSLTKPSLIQVSAPERSGTVTHDGHKLDLSDIPLQKILNGYYDQDQSRLVIELTDGSVAYVDGFLSERNLPGGIMGLTGGRGLTGEDGRSGKAGFIGTIGERGSEGVQGSMGPTGPRGNVGPTGPTGFTGPKGPRGNAGPTGDTGLDGDVNIAISYIDPGDTLGPKSLWVTPNGSFPELSGEGCTAYSSPCWVERFEVNCQTNDLPETTNPPTTEPPDAPAPVPEELDCSSMETVIYFCVDGSGSMASNDRPITVPTFVNDLVDQCEAKYNNPTYVYASSAMRGGADPTRETTDPNEVRTWASGLPAKYYGGILMDTFIKKFLQDAVPKASRPDVNPIFIMISDEIEIDEEQRTEALEIANANDFRINMIFWHYSYDVVWMPPKINHYKYYADQTGGKFLAGDSSVISNGTSTFLTSATDSPCSDGGTAVPSSGAAAPPPPPPPPPPPGPCSGECLHCIKLTRFPGGEVEWACSNSQDNPKLSISCIAYADDTGFKLEIIMAGRFQGQYSYLIGPWAQAGGIICRGGARKPTPKDWSGTDWDKIISNRFTKQVLYGCPLSANHGNLDFSFKNTVNLF
jgi:hypothetical protein